MNVCVYVSVYVLPRLVLVGINNTSKSCLEFPNIAVGLHLRTSNCLRAASIMSLTSSSFGSMKFPPLKCLALSGFGFSIVHLCFAFFFAASDIRVHISGHTSSGREVFCFLVSLLPDHVYPSGGLSFNKMNLVKPLHASDNSFLHPRSSNLQYVSPS